MNAPLLRERELFLVKKQSEGNGIRSLQMTADQLLFATLHLSLGNEGTMVSLSEIMVMQNNYDGPKSTFLVSTVTQWLNDMGRLDPRYNDSSILFNRFSSVCHYRMRYLTYPFYEERYSYLKSLEAQGMSYNRLHEYAWMQIIIIDRLSLTERNHVFESDLEKVIKDREAEDCSQGRTPSQKWIKTFRTVAYGWLSYAGILHREEKLDSLEYNVVCDYVQWAPLFLCPYATTLILFIGFSPKRSHHDQVIFLLNLQLKYHQLWKRLFKPHHTRLLSSSQLIDAVTQLYDHIVNRYKNVAARRHFLLA